MLIFYIISLKSSLSCIKDKHYQIRYSQVFPSNGKPERSAFDMQINYLDAVSSVLNMMKQPDSACKNIDMHRTCYTMFFKYLMDKGIPFSMSEV